LEALEKEPLRLDLAILLSQAVGLPLTLENMLGSNELSDDDVADA
jgi:hypothetical protein